MLTDTYMIVEAIAKLYSGRGAIVEFGVGFNPWIACNLKKRLPEARVIAVDRDLRALNYTRSVCPDLEVKLDDVTNLKVDDYSGVEIVYSIRPPPELIPYMELLARRVGALLIVRPLTEGESGYVFDERRWVRIHPYLYMLRV
ncbi:MAG: UPF0146 family protein [Nitrososphaerota archaeon]|nr:UPF0146 family protein [Candidatus Bathyarchaeota archaeon]MCX8161563.1 UPF0146 family protein [Candidatus Bathyarchaeota archaeon]MDW8061179.1 UPF0146 family protein [Nitrososphaerota archaeon]